MKQKKGFSIVEVLVALCIMGVVAGISVPNYTKMKRSSKKAEAQSSLGQIYISEKAFFLQWRTYMVDLTAIGAVPEGPLTYNVGFSGAGGFFACTPGTVRTCTKDGQEIKYGGPDFDEAKNNFYTICGKEFGEPSTSTPNTGSSTGPTPPTNEEANQCAFSHKKRGEYEGFEPPPIDNTTFSGIDCNATQKTFIACAIANLVKKDKTCGTKHCDKWSINQFKQIKRECGSSCPY